MKTYNGFPGDFRSSQGRYLKARIRAGLVKPPLACACCGLEVAEGATVHTHMEDYHRVDEYIPMCYCCHMALHKRYQDPKGWDAWLYRTRRGWQPPCTRGYGVFMQCWNAGIRWRAAHAGAAQAVVRPTDRRLVRLPKTEPDLYRPNGQVFDLPPCELIDD